MRVRVRARWYVLCWQLSRSALVRLKWCWWSVLRANAGHADLIGWAADREVAVRSQAGLPEGVAGVIVANELLDNLPARVVQRHGGQVQELWVAPGGVAPAFERPGIPAAGSELELTWRPMVGDDAAALAACEWWDNVPDDAPVPWSAGAAEWVAEAQRRLALGILVVVDYGARTSAEVAGRDGWLRTYAQGAVGTDPLENLGVATSPRTSRSTSCRNRIAWSPRLTPWFVGGSTSWSRPLRRLAARPDAALDLARARDISLLNEAPTLVDSAGLGAFLVAEWGAGG